METLEHKVRQNEAFARGYLEGFFGTSECRHDDCHGNIIKALHWLDGWVEGRSQRSVGDFKLPSCLF